MAILNEPPLAVATPTNHQRGERNMKKNWIISAGVALALGALATVAVAERGGKQPAMRMLNRLDLTAEQQEQLQALREAMHAQRETMAAANEEYREALMNILTDEQREALKEMRGRRGWAGKGRHDRDHDMRHDMRRGDRDRDMRRGGPGAFARLDLTDEQREQLKALRQEQRAERRATRQKHRTALESVLTDQQRERLELLKDEAFYGDKRWRGKR